MDDIPTHEGQFDKLTLRAGDFAKLIQIMSRGDRRAFVEVDGEKIDQLSELTDARVHAAREVDVNSYYSDPAKPHFGRRHFVYLVADRAGVRYFGDSHSPEVTRVCEELHDYLSADAAPRVAGVDAVGPTANALPAFLRGLPPMALWGILAGLIVLTFLVGFLAGRETAISQPLVIPTPDASMQMPADGPTTRPDANAPDVENNRP